MSTRGIYDGDCYDKRRAAALKGLKNKSDIAKKASLSCLKLKPKHHSKETKKKLSKAAKLQYVNAVKDGSERVRCKRISKSLRRFHKTDEAKQISAEAGKKISETKRNWSSSKKKSVYSKSMRNKISRWSKLYWDSLSEKDRNEKIRKFMLAPIHRKSPNKVEKNIIDLHIDKLQFTGDGKYFITLGKRWKKNPDFIIKRFKEERRTKGVIEIMDFEYWHSRSEAQYVKKLYMDKNVECMIIDAKKCYSKKDLAKIKSKIEFFIDKL